MGERNRRRRTAPKGALVGPLVMLGSGVAVGALLWRFLMQAPAPASGTGAANGEQLSHGDRQALERLIDKRDARP